MEMATTFTTIGYTLLKLEDRIHINALHIGISKPSCAPRWARSFNGEEKNYVHMEWSTKWMMLVVRQIQTQWTASNFICDAFEMVRKIESRAGKWKNGEKNGCR